MKRNWMVNQFSDHDDLGNFHDFDGILIIPVNIRFFSKECFGDFSFGEISLRCNFAAPFRCWQLKLELFQLLISAEREIFEF